MSSQSLPLNPVMILGVNKTSEALLLVRLEDRVEPLPTIVVDVIVQLSSNNSMLRLQTLGELWQWSGTSGSVTGTVGVESDPVPSNIVLISRSRSDRFVLLRSNQPSVLIGDRQASNCSSASQQHSPPPGSQSTTSSSTSVSGHHHPRTAGTSQPRHPRGNLHNGRLHESSEIRKQTVVILSIRILDFLMLIVQSIMPK